MILGIDQYHVTYLFLGAVWTKSLIQHPEAAQCCTCTDLLASVSGFFDLHYLPTDDMGSPRLRPQPRPSLSSRLSLAISTRSEVGEVSHPQEHIEEIDEIRRYEVRYSFLSEQEVSLTAGGAIGFHNDRFETSHVPAT